VVTVFHAALFGIRLAPISNKGFVGIALKQPGFDQNAVIGKVGPRAARVIRMQKSPARLE